jgi:hypothetical protein
MTEIAVISLVDNRTHVHPFTKSAFNTETPVPNVPAHEKYDDSQLQKAFRAGSRLKPLHCGKPCRAAVPIRNPMPGALSIRKLMRRQFQGVILCAEEGECNCLRGQVNGHKATCTSPCPPPSGQLSWLTNFAEFLAFFVLASPVLCRVPLLRIYIDPGPEGLEVFCHIGLAV